MPYKIEMLWTCSQCDHSSNRGSSRHCSNCGYPKDDTCEEYFPEDISENNAVQDAEKLRLANAGPDWKCVYCHSLQTDTGPFCAYCGADRKTGEMPWKTQVKVISQDIETGKKSEPRVYREGGKTVIEGGVVTQAFLERMAVSQSFEDGLEEPTGSPYRDPPRICDEVSPVVRVKRRIPWKPIAAVGLGLILLGLLLWAIFRTREVSATVSDTSWEYRVYIDRYQVWRHSGWYAEPGAFDITPEGARIHHYDRVVAGTHQVPYQESYTCGETCTTSPRTCTSSRNGYATCTGGSRSCYPKTCLRTAFRTVTDYREEPRYQEWYSWNVWDWGYNRTVTKSAHDLEPYWPKTSELEVPLQNGERERQRRETLFRVQFSTSDNKKYDFEPKTEEQYRRYPLGRAAKLRVGVWHGVEVL